MLEAHQISAINCTCNRLATSLHLLQSQDSMIALRSHALELGQGPEFVGRRVETMGTDHYKLRPSYFSVSNFFFVVFSLFFIMHIW